MCLWYRRFASYLRPILCKTRLIFPCINGLLSSYVPQILLQIQICSSLNLFASLPGNMPIVLSRTLLCISTSFYYMEQSQSIQELCPTICSSNCLTLCPFFVVRCLRRCQAHVQAVALWAAFCHSNNIVVKSTILLIFRHSHLQPVHRPSQCAIHCDDMCPAHCSPLSSSEQSSFLTKSIPTENVQPNVLLSQSYATPTPYALVFPHTTVHTVGSSIVWGDKVSIPIQNPGGVIGRWEKGQLSEAC